MTRPGFLHGVIAAAVLGLFASAVVATLTPFVGLGAVARLVIPLLGLAYLLYLLSRSAEKLGRVTTLAFWSAMTAVTWWAAPALPLYLLIHVGAVWLVRSLYFHSGVLPALMDLGLSALSVSAAVWAISRTGSVFLATWCFFLVQALFVTIPPTVQRKTAMEQDHPSLSGNFERAQRQADAALHQLISKRTSS
jgi:small-conductance mechanosensitive channel